MTRKQKIVDGIITVLIAPGALVVMVLIDGVFNWTGENKMIASIAISFIFWFWLLLSIIL